MKFHYTASNKDGKMVEGDVDAQGVSEVLEILVTRSLKPISLKKAEGFILKPSRQFLQPSITIGDKIFLAKYLALMLKIGTDLFNSINILISDMEKPVLRAFLYEIKSNLEKGQPFYMAFARYPKHFSAVFVNLIKAGEASGNLDKTFNRLSVDLQKEQELRHEIRSALAYPSILMVVAVSIVFLITSFALPKISGLFENSGFTPPVFSRVVFAVGFFMNKYFIFIVPALVAIIIAAVIFFRRSAVFKKIFQRLIRRLPLIGPLLRKIAIQRFASTFGSLLSSGLPLLESLEITANTVGDEEIKEALMRISREGISKGLTMGEAFKTEPAFPRVISNLVAISEKSGNLSEILSTLSDFYEVEIKSSVKIMITFLEPILLLFIGAVIGIIALAILIPIYQLVGSFR